MKKILLFLSLFLISSQNVILAGQPKQDLLIADFEAHCNQLGGQIGVYGAGEPDLSNKDNPFSGYYTVFIKGCQKENIFNGKQSFRLVNGGGPRENVGWASFGLNLGPVIDEFADPIKVKPLDVSGYRYLVFWAKGEKGGERIIVNFRDSNAPGYLPQYTYKVNGSLLKKWKKIAVPLSKVYNVDLKNLVHVGLSFGEAAKNRKGDIIYVDDWYFTNALVDI